MPRFVVRTNCEYSIDVDADNADEALAKADKTDMDDWTQAWASMEAEEE